MNNDAHEILVSAIASHGEKLATSDAYCKVYLAGYMVDYSEEKKLLTSLRQLELPEVLLAYQRSEISNSDVYSLIKALELKHLHKQCDFAWGVDAWAAALTVPDLIRRDIRKQCFPLVSQGLNSDLESDINEGVEYDEVRDPEVKTNGNQRKALMSVSAMILLGLSTAHFAVGSVAVDKSQSKMMLPVKTVNAAPANIVSEKDRPTNTALLGPTVTRKVPRPELVTLQYLGKQDRESNISRTEQSPKGRRSLADLAKLTVTSPKAINNASAEAVLIDENTIKEPQLNLDTPTKALRAQRLNADIEAFLKQEH